MKKLVALQYTKQKVKFMSVLDLKSHSEIYQASQKLFQGRFYTMAFAHHLTGIDRKLYLNEPLVGELIFPE